jgi:pimeloyl-ACP methyl ester carboxylesterase/nucleotide-binding universal stress UspA family protein
MNRIALRFPSPLLLGCLLMIVPSVGRSADQPDDAAKEIVLADCLVLRPVGTSGRTPVHVDAVEADIVAGRWKAPRAGEKVMLPGGVGLLWEAADAKNGALGHPALRGGYAYWKVTAETPRVLLLEASGHSMVYVNGEPRTGDPYSNGIVRLPVLLRKGDNDFLFHCGRGRLQAKLTVPKAAVLLDVRDATLPDWEVGEKAEPWAALVVINASERPAEGLALQIKQDAKTAPLTVVPSLPPLSTRKIGFRLPATLPREGDGAAAVVELVDVKADKKQPLDTVTLNLRVRKADQSRKRTFVSAIDGSVQYYAVQPARPDNPSERPALFLTLHGASVEAIGQADAYSGKSWGHLVAPTNRRPYGFDWEDWGRLDALEVLELAQKEMHTDPLRTYLTGHSMGGHGTWHVGAIFPDRFAAIAPSAGWVSFYTYAGGRRPEKPDAMQSLLLRAAAASDTPTLARNYAGNGVYVLHGEADDNVPVSQARTMRKVLADFHPDFAYYERPGAGHWWGSACVDWPPLFDFLKQHTLPKPETMPPVDFVTVSPAVSARYRWATVEAQVHPWKPSTVNLRFDAAQRRFSGKTDNVARLALDLAHVPAGESVKVDVDGQKMEPLAWPEKEPRLWIERKDNQWTPIARPSPTLKGPHRGGPFKDAFRHRFLFVYGTRGTPEENAWAFAKARYDAETWWYRGNGVVDLRADTAFDASQDRDRSVILYGNADTNAAWKTLLADSPIQVSRSAVRVGERTESGNDLACLFVRPRPDSDVASVGVVSGTGAAGMRLADRLPYFVSGVAYPDWIVLGSETLTRGSSGVRGAGFFGNDWGLATGEEVWRE